MEHDAIVHDSAGPQEIQSLQDSLQEEAESCYFEGVWHNHDKEWSPVYDTKCTSCICEVRLFFNILLQFFCGYLYLRIMLSKINP